MNAVAYSPLSHGDCEPTLPVLSPGLPYLLSALGDDEIDLDALVEAVRCFPSITGRLVALANSAWVSPKRAIVSLPDACSMLGLRMVRCVSFALAVSRPFDPSRCPGFDLARYWGSALLTAEGAALLAQQLNDQNLPVDTAHTAGLLHNLGLMWLADSWPTPTSTALQAAASETCQLADALLDITGNDYCAAGGTLGEAWHLPESLTIAIRHHRHADYRGPHWQSAAVCGVAARMASRLWRGEAWTHDAGDDVLKLAPHRLQSVFEQLAGKRESIQQLSKTLFA